MLTLNYDYIVIVIIMRVGTFEFEDCALLSGLGSSMSGSIPLMPPPPPLAAVDWNNIPSPMASQQQQLQQQQQQQQDKQQPTQKSALDDLDILGQSLLQHNIPADRKLQAR